MDGFAHARDSRGVGHGKIRACLERHLGHHFNLSADVHKEGAIRDVDDFDTVDVLDCFNDLFAVFAGSGVDGNVPRNEIKGDTDDVDGTYISAGATNRAGQLS